MVSLKLLTPLLLIISSVHTLDNGLALTPPMGWMHWERFRCLIDCNLYPDDCISETLFRTMADLMVSDGYLAAGYEYVIIDDCWLATTRDENGLLQPDPERFPNGIKALADYIHEKGLKFGIYEDYGNYTCAGYPGSLGHLLEDATTFAEWGVDYLKFDGCYTTPDQAMVEGYAEMSSILNNTGRPIVFSCSFPAYQGLEANYSAAVDICNLWRNFDDIQDSWESIETIVAWFSTNQETVTSFAGPGHWNDPDMLIIGNYGLSYDQCKSQMTLWSLMAAPLIMSVDLRTIKPEFREILLNADLIRINQDPMGIPGRYNVTINAINFWLKPILPQVGGSDSYAIGIVSSRTDGYPYRIEITLQQLGLTNENGFVVKNIFDQTTYPYPIPITEPISIKVNPLGAVLLEATPV